MGDEVSPVGFAVDHSKDVIDKDISLEQQSPV
jgi:hypothetical protein